MVIKLMGFAAGLVVLSVNPILSNAKIQHIQQRVEQAQAYVPAAGQPQLAAEPPLPSLKWECFHSEQITLEQTEVLFNGASVSMPQMQIRTPDHWYEVSLGGDTQVDFDSVFGRWQELVQGSQSVCISMQMLQRLDPNEGLPSSLWLIHSLKTDRGEWSDN